MTSTSIPLVSKAVSLSLLIQCICNYNAVHSFLIGSVVPLKNAFGGNKKCCISNRYTNHAFVSFVSSDPLDETLSLPEKDNAGMTAIPPGDTNVNRRSMLLQTIASSMLTLGFITSSPQTSNAAVGSLYEYTDTNAIIQGITINVADLSQQTSMIQFLQESFAFQVLRQGTIGEVTDTWLGFGPEGLDVPNDFRASVSSFGRYGGHASIHLRYDSKSADVFYRGPGTDLLGDNIAFLQVGVPAYKISKMTEYKGNVLDAFGYVNVISPSGLPIRGIIGIWPDPMMFVAINCDDVSKSRVFYEQLGFLEQSYPYARLSKGTSPLEPEQPKKSVYLSPSKNGMGVLLLPSDKKRKQKITPNPVFQSLDIVYNPNTSDGKTEEEGFGRLVDPSGVSLSFVSQNVFKAEERATRYIAEEQDTNKYVLKK